MPGYYKLLIKFHFIAAGSYNFFLITFQAFKNAALSEPKTLFLMTPVRTTHFIQHTFVTVITIDVIIFKTVLVFLGQNRLKL